MGIPLHQAARIGAYVARKHFFSKDKHYPLVLMLEPLFRCNLACAGCGKIDYPDAILNDRISLADALAAIDECGAPVVSIAGGEPLLHKEIDQIVKGAIARKKFVYLCSNGLLMEKKMDLFEPSPFFTWQVHLDGSKQEHDHSVCQEGVYEVAVRAIKLAKSRGFRVNINCTLFSTAVPERVAKFLDDVHEMGVDGVTISPGYSYERAPDTEHFLARNVTKSLFREIFKLGKGKKWSFNQSSLFLDFLAGNQTYECHAWSTPCRNPMGWQRPCYLLGEGYAKTYREMIDGTDWSQYGTGNYEKCANCMVHCGFEGAAVADTFAHPLNALKVALNGPRTEGPFAPDLSLANQRPAEDVYAKLVADQLASLEAKKAQKAAA